MPIERGKTFLLKIGDGEASETFTTVGKMRSTGFSGTRESIDTTHKDSNDWATRIPSFKSMSLSASGVYDGGAQQLAVRDAWLQDATADPVNFQIVGDTGDTWEGPFIVTQWDNEGEHNGERTWSVSLESAGEVTVTDA